jgi:hypothetical protein
MALLVVEVVVVVVCCVGVGGVGKGKLMAWEAKGAIASGAAASASLVPYLVVLLVAAGVVCTTWVARVMVEGWQ